MECALYLMLCLSYYMELLCELPFVYVAKCSVYNIITVEQPQRHILPTENIYSEFE